MIPHAEFPTPQCDIPHSETSDASPHTPHPSPPTASKRGRPPIFDALKQHTFLRLVSVGFSTRRAARLIGVSPSTVREKARTSPPFACGYEDAKAQAIPALAENVFHAGKRSWRASAWLLERLRPSQFGHRVALGPDPAKRRELERLRQENKKEQLDLQKPEWNDQILIRCIRRLLTDRRAQEIFDAIADDLDREFAEQTKAASEEPQSPTDPVDNSDSAPPPETHDVCDNSTDPATPPNSTTNPPASTSCAPTPSAKNSDAFTPAPNTQIEAPQSQPSIPSSPTPPNSCALTPQPRGAETPPAICEVTRARAPSRPPPLSDLSAQQCAMIIVG